MRFFKRESRATEEQKKRGRIIAVRQGLPRILRDLPTGVHSYERRFLIRRFMGYKTRYDSIDVHKVMTREKALLERTCRELGIIPVFKGDYISLGSFPRRNIIREEILCKGFRNGVKTIEKKAFFDIIDYISQ